MVCQEATRLNVLLGVVSTSLSDIGKCFAGTLNVTQQMEDCMAALGVGEVPGRNIFSSFSWEKHAWPSLKTLASWFEDMVARVAMVRNWTSDFALPYSVWISGMLNPTAMITSLKYVTRGTACCCYCYSYSCH